MKPKLTLCQIGRIVNETPEMFDEYCKRISESEIKYSRGNNKVKGKRVGIRRFILAQQYIAQSVYNDLKTT